MGPVDEENTTADETGDGAAERTAGSLSAVRVVIADDHQIWRAGVRADLGDNFEVVGEAGDGTEAVQVINETKPDLVLCDLNMPNGGGIKVATECGEMTRVVMLTVSQAERDLLDAISAGACGYLLKSTPSEELRNQLWKAATGILAIACGPRAHRVPPGEQSRSSGRSTQSSRARSPAACGSRSHLPRDRRRALHRRENGRKPRAEHLGQAASKPQERAHALRHRARHRIGVVRIRCAHPV